MASLPGRMLLLLTLLVVVAAAVWWQRETGTAKDAQDRAVVRTVAVFPLAAALPQAGSELTGSGVGYLLAHRLSGNGPWRRIAPHSLLRKTEPRTSWGVDRARARTAELGAAAFVVGSVRLRGEEVDLEALWFDADSPVPGSTARASGPVRHLARLVDDLGEQLEKRRLSPEEVHIARVAAVTSDSLPALLAYFRAEDGLGQGDFATAQAELERAVEADPQFALAYYRLAEIAAWRGEEERAAQARQNALLLSNRLPVQERALCELWVLRLRNQLEDAARGYESLLQQQPSEWEAWCGLAEVRWQQGDRLGVTRAVQRARPLLADAVDVCGARARGWLP